MIEGIVLLSKMLEVIFNDHFQHQSVQLIQITVKSEVTAMKADLPALPLIKPNEIPLFYNCDCASSNILFRKNVCQLHINVQVIQVILDQFSTRWSYVIYIKNVRC